MGKIKEFSQYVTEAAATPPGFPRTYFINSTIKKRTVPIQDEGGTMYGTAWLGQHRGREGGTWSVLFTSGDAGIEPLSKNFGPDHYGDTYKEKAKELWSQLIRDHTGGIKLDEIRKRMK